jgi:stage II sporulation protein D
MRSLSLIALLLSSFLFGQEMRIGLMSGVKLSEISFQVGNGNYLIYADTSQVDILSAGQEIRCKVVGGETVFLLDSLRITGKNIRFVPQSDSDYFNVKGIASSTKIHSYHGHLLVSVKSGKFSLVNLVSMENYLGGVIESEGGGGRHLEYYKVQAVMSRSYALKNKNRHAKEGFELCDAVHCQAYHNRCKNEQSIKVAVEQTRGEVISDQSGKIITTYFYANCGGQTSPASYVWNTDISYCSPFIDTFCIHTRQAKWEKSIPRSSWENYIRKEFGVDLSDSSIANFAYNFHQDQRKAFYIHPSFGIPLRDLRTEFGLKSTYFDVHLVGDNVELHGRGFGHGVGLCQEGAMEMAKKGYNYVQIALFYFNGVELLRLNSALE